MDRIISSAILILTGVFLAASQMAAAGTQATNLALTIEIRNCAKVDPETLAKAERVAALIFGNAGVETPWVELALASEDRLETSIDIRPPIYQIQVSIIPDAMAERIALPNNVMGLAPGVGPGRQMVYVFNDRVDALAQRQVLALMKGEISRPATRNQILGHTVAHELGHLLLNLASHSASGIMRGNWDLKDLQDAGFGSCVHQENESCDRRSLAWRGSYVTIQIVASSLRKSRRSSITASLFFESGVPVGSSASRRAGLPEPAPLPRAVAGRPRAAKDSVSSDAPCQRVRARPARVVSSPCFPFCDT
jgi:hypothetical protein